MSSFILTVSLPYIGLYTNNKYIYTYYKRGISAFYTGYVAFMVSMLTQLDFLSSLYWSRFDEYSLGLDLPCHVVRRFGLGLASIITVSASLAVLFYKYTIHLNKAPTIMPSL